MSIDINKLRQHVTNLKASEVLVFQPTRDQMQAKSNFWASVMEKGIQVPLDLELEAALNLGAYTGISEWWTSPGFREWFRNSDEFRQKLEFLANVSLDHLERILLDDKANAAAKVASIKLIMELSKKMPSKSSEDGDFLDKKIGEMDKKQLEQYIQSRIALVPKPT